MGRQWPALRLGHWMQKSWGLQGGAGINLFEGGCLRQNQRERTEPAKSTESWIKDLLSMAPPIRARPRFPYSQTLQSGNFHKPLILIHQKADRWKPQLKKTNQSDHMDQPCLTQWNYEPWRVGPPKMDGSWCRVLTKCGPLDKGMANHFNILALRTP